MTVISIVEDLSVAIEGFRHLCKLGKKEFLFGLVSCVTWNQGKICSLKSCSPWTKRHYRWLWRGSLISNLWIGEGVWIISFFLGLKNEQLDGGDSFKICLLCIPNLLSYSEHQLRNFKLAKLNQLCGSRAFRPCITSSPRSNMCQFLVNSISRMYSMVLLEIS